MKTGGQYHIIVPSVNAGVTAGIKGVSEFLRRARSYRVLAMRPLGRKITKSFQLTAR